MSSEANLDIMALHREFAETEHGLQLAGQVRYERYKPDGVSYARWIEILGVDVNNLGHMQLTWGLSRDMNRQLRIQQPGFLDEHDEKMLEVMAIIHDRGEAVVGDVNFGEKSEEFEAAEREALAGMVDGSHQLIQEAALLLDTDSKLGLVFNSVERVGYMRTALRAANHVRKGSAPDCEDGLRWIVADVFGNQPIVLLSRLDVHQPIRGYLYNMRYEITEAFKTVQPEDFENYKPDIREAKKEAFGGAFLQWNQYLERFGDDTSLRATQ